MDFVSALNISPDKKDRFVNLMDEVSSIFGENPSEVKLLSGGLSNQAFFVCLESGKKLVVRISTPDYDRVVNRSREKQNATAASRAGIGPTVYAFHDNGDSITEFLDSDTMSITDLQTRPEVLTAAGKILARLHSGVEGFSGIFDPFEGIRNYRNIQHENGFYKDYEGWDQIYQTVLRIEELMKKNPPKLCPCHCDVLSENMMFDGKDIKLIDWEFSGISDPYYDISGVLCENKLDEKACEIYLNAYFGRTPSEEEKAHIYLSRFLYTVFWSQWGPSMISIGREWDFHWSYSLERINQALSYMNDPDFEKYFSLI